MLLCETFISRKNIGHIALDAKLLPEKRITNGRRTSDGFTTTRSNLRAEKITLFSRQVLLNSAEKHTVNPNDMNHGIATHALLHASWVLLLSSKLNGINASPIISVPTHIIMRKGGCAAFTAALLC
jgi:hypothetical protein